jgi:transcriptional regulator with XRE-family HTH domain
MNVIEKIKFLAKQKRFSIADLEEAAGLPRNRIQKWSDPEEIKLGHIQAIARVLETSVGELLGEPSAAMDDDESQFLALARRLGKDEAWDRLLQHPRLNDPPPKQSLPVVGEIDLAGHLERQQKRSNTQPTPASTEPLSPNVRTPSPGRNPNDI